MPRIPLRHDPARITEQLLAARSEHPDPADGDRVRALWQVDAFPRSATYDPAWSYANHMGPNALWLTEALSEVMVLGPGMHVLDLGCGTALSSIFLAKEFGVRVTAVDLWVPPGDNWERIVAAGVGHLVTPLHAEAHALPFADEVFDAVVSMDSYHYFGTDERYLPSLLRFVKEGCQLGIVVPGNSADPEDPPDGLTEAFPAAALSDFFTFRSPAWWRRLWVRSGVVDVEVADMVPDGRSLWHRCLELDSAWEGIEVADQMDWTLLDSAAGQTLGFTRVVARRLDPSASGAVTRLPSVRTTVERTGDVVARPAAAWSPAVLSFLRYLEDVGFDGAPRPVGTGFDEMGRETVRYVEGGFVHPHAWSDAGIFELGALLRQLHDAAVGFDPPEGSSWQDWHTRSEAPDAIVGHGDPGPWNIVERHGLPVALIDWELAGPVDRLAEVAHAAWTNAQLHDDDVAQRNGLPSPEHRAAQLGLFVDGYGLTEGERAGFVDRLVEIAIQSCANEAVRARIGPDSTDPTPLWALAWRARSAAWMIRHRSLLEQAIR
ncbi:MAG TPA: methyltransferase domain-containing protein [Acidimicrobiales bacterium]